MAVTVQTTAVPQANNLALVRAVVAAVGAGLATTSAIGKRAKLSPRHVRYYLLAAETLGWIDVHGSQPQVTTAGRAILTLPPQSLVEGLAFASAISASAALQETVGDYLRRDTDHADLVARLLERTNLSEATARRRAACLLAWRSQLTHRGWSPEPVLAQPVAGVVPSIDELSARAQNVLERLGVRTMEDLGRISAERLERSRGCGRKTMREIMAWARTHDVGSETNGRSRVRRAPLTSVEAMPVELLLGVSDLNLSVRAARCLAALGIVRVGDLVGLTAADLLEAPNCGRTTVKELKALVASLGLSLGMQVPVWKEADVTGLAKRHADALALLCRNRSAALYAVDSSQGLELEIKSALAAALKPSDLPKVELWIGLDQMNPPTLQDVGEVSDVTRERIRQIVERAKDKLSLAKLAMPQLRAAVTLLESLSVLAEAKAEALLRSEGISKRKVSARGLVRAAEFFGVQTQLQHARIEGTEFIGTLESLETLKSVLRISRRAITHWGCSTVEDIYAQVQNDDRSSISVEAIREALVTQSGFRWLDEPSGWFWIVSIPRNRVLNKIDKVLAVAPTIDLGALRSGIARHYRMEGFAPPTRVLKALCEQLDDCTVVDGTTVVDRRPRDPKVELSDQERAMVDVFEKHGPALSYVEVVRRCIDVGLNETTTNIYLGNSPVLRRVVAGVYTLVGASVSPAEIDAVAKTINRGRRSQIVQDFGWHSGGSRIWATYKISGGMLRSGVVGVPAGIRSYLDSSGYELRGSDDSRIGRIGLGDSSMWGFLPFFRRRGGDVGDFLRVTFNLPERTAIVEVAEEPFDENWVTNHDQAAG